MQRHPIRNMVGFVGVFHGGQGRPLIRIATTGSILILQQQKLLYQHTVNQMSRIRRSTRCCCGCRHVGIIDRHGMVFHQTWYGAILIQDTSAQGKYCHGFQHGFDCVIYIYIFMYNCLNVSCVED